MAQEIFKRTEKKYLLSAQQYRAFLAALEPFVKRDRYFESDIMSLYYDTPDYRLIRASIEKPVFKEKIRLRSYGVPRSADDVFLEIKRKYKGVVYKRRSVMPLSRAAGFPETARDTQIEKELAWCFDFYEGLAPQMLITYKRHAYTALSDPELRITFDSELLFRDYDLRLDKGHLRTKAAAARRADNGDKDSGGYTALAGGAARRAENLSRFVLKIRHSVPHAAFGKGARAEQDNGLTA